MVRALNVKVGSTQGEVSLSHGARAADFVVMFVNVYIPMPMDETRRLPRGLASRPKWPAKLQGMHERKAPRRRSPGTLQVLPVGLVRKYAGEKLV